MSSSRTPRTPGQAWLFHGGGLVAVAIGAVGAFIASVLVSLGTSVCFEPAAQAADNLRQLRVGLLVIGISLTAVPGLWSGLAAKLRFRWQPWAAVSGLIAAGVVVIVASVDQPATFCF